MFCFLQKERVEGVVLVGKEVCVAQVESQVSRSGRLLDSGLSSETWPEIIEQGSAKESRKHFRWEKTV